MTTTTAKTRLVPVLCREVEEGDRVVWGGRVVEVLELGPWEANAHPLTGNSRAALLREDGQPVERRRVTHTGVMFMVEPPPMVGE